MVASKTLATFLPHKIFTRLSLLEKLTFCYWILVSLNTDSGHGIVPSHPQLSLLEIKYMFLWVLKTFIF